MKRKHDVQSSQRLYNCMVMQLKSVLMSSYDLEVKVVELHQAKLDVLRRVSEDEQILNSIWQRKRRWIGHVLRHNGLCMKLLKAE